MSRESGFLYHSKPTQSGLMDYAIPQMPDNPEAIKKGDLGQYKKLIRAALQDVGFHWVHTKGRQDQDYDNIDGFDSISLENMVRAYKKYGWPVADLHNRKKFNQTNTKSYYNIEQIIKKYEDDYDQGPGENPTENGDNGNETGLTMEQAIQQWLAAQQAQNNGNSGSNEQPAWLVPAMIGAGGLLLFIVLQ